MTDTPQTPPGLRLFTSNRLETLADQLAERMRSPLASPLLPEIIVVRHRGMERWLRLELAQRLGISANLEFFFPEEISHELFRAVTPDAPLESAARRDTLLWRIVESLPALLDRTGFEPVRHYLGAQPEPRKLVQLASRLAQLFEQYLVYRPEMVLEWDNRRVKPEEVWQAALWREISGGFREHHPAALWRSFREKLAQGSAKFPGLPERIHLFGLPALAPFYLDVFTTVATRCEVNLFLLQPSQEYWGDITSKRDEDRKLRRQSASTSDSEETPDAFALHLETGNLLLASLGYLGRDFLKLVLDSADWESEETFTEPGEDTLLHCVQSDILHLRERPPHPVPLPLGGGEGARRAGEGHDDSIQVHCCHSPLRELEVLHDQMLDWFQRDPLLAPRDIIVMTPDIDAYAPFVQAVFGAPEFPSQRIPFSIADRGARSESHVIETFLQLLALPDTRLGAATVLAPLETESVRRRFKLTESDLETIRDWVRATNIRWGMDAAHRRSLGLPEFAANSWQAGLDRLLLGHSLAAHSGQLFDGILPFDDLEGSAADVAGRLAEYIERLFKLVRSLEQPRPAAEWAGVLASVLDEFFLHDDSAERELQTIRSELAALRHHATDAGCEVKLPLSAVLEQLRPALEASLSQSGFLTGGVTFCGLKPMRSVPFKIVCVIGLDDTAFPRPAPQSSFDLMAQRPRLGDRSAREDDRYLFLEILLSARERLHLSYVGLSARDNREAPPSVLVNELLDYLEQGFGLDRKQLTTRHRLQAFSPEYFNGRDAKLFSFSEASAEASRHATKDEASSRIVSAPFLVRPLGEPEPEFRHLSIDDLIRFFTNPARAFLQRRMKLFLPDEPEEIEEREVFHLEKLGETRLKKQLLESLIDGHDSVAVRETLRAEGSLPVGTAGDLAFLATDANVEEFWKLLAPQLPFPALPPLDVVLTVGAFQITGRIHPLNAQGPLVFRCAKLKANDLLRAWLYHLAANATQPGRITTLVTEDELCRFRPPEDARHLLEELLNHYWAGLQAPLKFFPRSAFAFVKQAQPGTKAKTVPPIAKARAEWEGNEQRGIPGEKDDAANTLCFRETDPLDAEFERLARSIFTPVLEHQLPDSP